MRLLKKIYRRASGSLVRLRYRGRTHREIDAPLVVEIDIRNFYYSRYFYSFVKFIEIEGGRTRMRFNAETWHDLKRAQYGNMVLSEGLLDIETHSAVTVSICDGGGEGVAIEAFDFIPASDPAVYDIPMAQHPLMYAKGLWDREIRRHQTNASILFVGNSDEGIYAKIEQDQVFDIVGRVRLQEIARRTGMVKDLVKSELLNPGDKPCILFVDSSRFPIAMEHFRETVARFGFFLCAPGVFMPLCHNLVEAMSVGTIPLIQRSYVDLMQPNLEHGKNAMIFESESDLLAILREAMGMSKDNIERMSLEVISYYQRNLTPRAIVENLQRPGLRKIRMLAGERSVALLRKGLSST